MKEVESALPQKKEINYVRALDKYGNPILISKEDLAQVVGELIPIANATQNGLLSKQTAPSQWAPFAIRESCISTGEPSSDFCVYIAGNTMELQDTTKVYVKYMYGNPIAIHT